MKQIGGYSKKDLAKETEGEKRGGNVDRGTRKRIWRKKKCKIGWESEGLYKVGKVGKQGGG